MLNPHVFPIVEWPGPPPEVSARSGQGNWDAYALAAPADRLLPFVLTRLAVPGGARWLNCATIVDADTEQVLFTLIPTGQTPNGPGPLGLVLAKVPDGDVEHFIYYGAIIPTLNLPCGRPLRLLLDNHWQSARFLPIAALSGPPDLPSTDYQRLEWSHSGPLSGVPYGSGLVQRLYVENGGLQYAAPREVLTTVQDASTGVQRTDFTAEFARRTTTAGLAPRYLADALAGAKAHRRFTVDGQPWKLVEVKEAVAGTDGGRWTMTLTLEDPFPLQSRLACPAGPLPVLAFDPTLDAPRGWRCGDTSDVAPDFQPTGTSSCEVDDNQQNTGYLLSETTDQNPNSSSFGQVSQVRTYDPAACPLATRYFSAYYSETARKNDCGTGYMGTTLLFEATAKQFSSTLSQAAANQLAIDYVRAGKQGYANQQGTCELAPRRVYLENIAPGVKTVRFDIVRTDAVGEMSVRVLVQAVVDDSTSTSTRQFQKTFIVDAGETRFNGVPISYDGAVLIEFQLAEIIAVTPTDYAF